MLTVSDIYNPFEFRARPENVWKAPDGLSVRGLRRLKESNFVEFDFPTICHVNGQPWKRDKWDERLPDGAHVIFTRIPGDPVTLTIITLVTVIVAVVVVLLYKPKKPKLVKPQEPHLVGAFGGAAVHTAASHDQQNGDPVYSLSGERNASRLNNVIECAYGRNRIFPAYAAQPYNVYAGNNQYQYSLHCLGHGWFEVEEMRYEDTPLSSFPDIEYEIVDPGEKFELFADNVITSAEVSNQELFASNEPEYTGWTTPFVTNPPFTKTDRLEVDLALPSGLYAINTTTGAMLALSVSVAFQYQELNDLGEPLGSWKPMSFRKVEIVPKTTGPFKKTQYSTKTFDFFDISLATATPQRYTLSAPVPPGRYQVKAMRRNAKNRSLQAADVVRWETLRAFLPSVHDYGDVTLIALKTRATNNLNNNAAAKFNVIATRKLPMWTPSGGWSAPQKTRSLVWAFCDVFRATYGGRLSHEFLDMEELAALNAEFEAERRFFDYIFDQKSTVWEAARAIARVGRGIPVLQGSRVTIVRDVPQTFAKAVFNPYNMIANSFTWNIRLNSITAYDGLEVEYVDSETWKLETVLCLLEDDAGDYPEPLRLTGCTDRQRAYQEGLYARSLQKYGKEIIRFDTGLEGYLPRYGDLVLVSHDVPRWGQGGFVDSIDGTELTLSDPVEFAEGVVHKIVLRKKDGSAFGPVTVTAGATSFKVLTASPVDPSFYYFDDTHERPLFLFGKENLASRECLVVGITPKSKDVVSLECIPYDERVYSYGSFQAPPRNATAVRVVEPSRPVVVDLQVNKIPDTLEFVTVSWPPALGAKTYVLEQSPDGENWTRVVTQPSTIYTMRVNPGLLYVRVAGVGTDIGPWAYWNGRVGTAITKPATVANLHTSTLSPGTVVFGWDPLSQSDSYEVNIYSATNGRFIRRVVQQATEFTYTINDAEADGLTDRNVTFRVKGINIAGISDSPATLTVVIPDYNPETQPTDASITLFTADNTDVQSDTV